MHLREQIKTKTQNLGITSRITLSTVCGILIPVTIIFISGTIFLNYLAAYFNFAGVTTDSYSMLNQIQWNQTVGSISNELILTENDHVKKKHIQDFASGLENYGVKMYIECNGEEFYASAAKKEVLTLASSITKIDTNHNINYFGDNGLVIVSHANTAGKRYLLIIASRDYTVNDTSIRQTAQDFTSLVFGKSGILIFIIISVFILSILALSLQTARTISKPLKALASGANEIAGGNLNYHIPYQSTNEIGTTVDAFNRMTRQLKQSLEDKARVEESRKEMIAGAAHDLRTPLTSVKGYLEGLQDGIANTPEMREQYLKTIYTSTLAMEKMLDDLLTVSRLELGSIQLDTEIINLNDFLEDCAEELGFELREQGFDFHYDNRCENPLMTKLDAVNFRRVIQNIVSNSVKYARKDVKGKIELSAQSYNKSVIISLSDNGTGVDAASLPRIFETFYRTDKSRTKVTEGSGLGLSVCRQIVELHGGHIWATSTEGAGLTVLISLEKTTEENTNG